MDNTGYESDDTVIIHDELSSCEIIVKKIKSFFNFISNLFRKRNNTY